MNSAKWAQRVPWFSVRRVAVVVLVGATVAAVRQWRATRQAVRRGRESGDRMEVVARMRGLQ